MEMTLDVIQLLGVFGIYGLIINLSNRVTKIETICKINSDNGRCGTFPEFDED